MASHCPLVLAVGARRLSNNGQEDLVVDIDGTHEIPSDALASQNSAENVGEQNSVAAGRKKIDNTDDASQFSAGALRAPSLASQGSQRSKAASGLPAGDPGLGSLTLQCRDVSRCVVSCSRLPLHQQIDQGRLDIPCY